MIKAKVGDRIKLRMGNISLAEGRVKVRPGSRMTVPAKIARDKGDNWVVQLDIDVDGLSYMVIPKSAQVNGLDN